MRLRGTAAKKRKVRDKAILGAMLLVLLGGSAFLAVMTVLPQGSGNGGLRSCFGWLRCGRRPRSEWECWVRGKNLEAGLKAYLADYPEWSIPHVPANTRRTDTDSFIVESDNVDLTVSREGYPDLKEE